ncbi:hypothetical protein TanjilG_03225 [Lupinus angustifolius]|uniref:Uncharacterized protein n=1 Tax=Lupinus angustifolius TaxID=3871 RepID=A0A4P1RD98_LUPAN|nr:hypothetical protein TanjilG_03225 [Lupinus angustifolius]
MGRAPCCDKANVKRGSWSTEEDSKLKDYIQKHGTAGNWIALPHKAGLRRCGKSCRLRWLNYLRPNIKHGQFSYEEDMIILSLYVNIGSRKAPFLASNHQNPPPSSPLSSIYSDYNFSSYYSTTPTALSFTDLEPISYPSTNFTSTSCTATSLSLPFYQNQDSTMVSASAISPMQCYYSMFGSEGSCSSSDGSCTQIKQEEKGYPSYMSTSFDELNKFMLNYNIYGIGENFNQWDEKSNVLGFAQTHTPLENYYNVEDIKQLISSGCSSFINIDENKTEEKGMY